MKKKAPMEISVKVLTLVIGRKELHLSIEDAKRLKVALEALFNTRIEYVNRSYSQIDPLGLGGTKYQAGLGNLQSGIGAATPKELADNILKFDKSAISISKKK